MNNPKAARSPVFARKECLMLSRRKLTFKIGLSFGLLLLVTLTVGALAVWKMSGVNSLQEKMDQAHVRQVAIVGGLERHWAQAIFELRG
jgi:hypothetical protein